MKTLLIVMIILSLIIGLPINGGWYTLYNFEFPGVYSMIAAGTFPMLNFILWGILLIAHAFIVVLPFIIKTRFFKSVLILAPTIFLLMYSVLNPMYLAFLVPFIIVWIVCLFKYKPTVNYTNPNVPGYVGRS